MLFRRYRLLILISLAFAAKLPAWGQFAPPVTGSSSQPQFLVGASGSDKYIQYSSSTFNSVPVGKTLVLPVALSGSGPMTYTATSTDKALLPIVKTGYAELVITVSYAGDPSYTGTTSNASSFSGNMVFELLRDMAPNTVATIAGLAEGGYYNGLDFFRIANLTGQSGGFIAQAGDPTETGTGGPGFIFDNEFNPSLIFSGGGQLAMANAGIDQGTYQGTNSSQFFVTQGRLRSLDFNHTIFGQLVSGFDIMNRVMSVPLTNGTGSPTVPVVMQKVIVRENNTDAILLVSAGGSATSLTPTIKVTAVDPLGNKATTTVTSGTTVTTGTGLPGITLNTTADKDFVNPDGSMGINDPPIITPVPDVEVSLHQSVSLPIKAVDLEFDDLIKSATLLAGEVNVTSNGNTANVSPYSFAPMAAGEVGLSVYQPLTAVQRTNPYDQTHVRVALGDGKMTPLPQLITSGTGQELGSLGQFLESDPRVTGSSFSAEVNFGDGSPVVSASNTAVVHSSGAGPTGFQISLTGTQTHSYRNPGIYPLTIAVSDSTSGLMQLRNTAVVSSGSMFALGRSFVAPKGLASTEIATFTDGKAGTTPANYVATINWGDGAVTAGSIGGSRGNFYVNGKHQYAAGTTFPVDVTVTSLVGSGSPATAWSIANLTGVSTLQPPFAQAHLVAQLGSPGFASSRSLSEEVTILNSGNKKSGAVNLAFYLSDSQDFSPSTATRLSVANKATYETVPLSPGQVIQGTVSNIFLPPGVSPAGKFLVMVILYSDPIQSQMAAPDFFIDPIPLF